MLAPEKKGIRAEVLNVLLTEHKIQIASLKRSDSQKNAAPYLLDPGQAAF
jgi:hypothetical protein